MSRGGAFGAAGPAGELGLLALADLGRGGSAWGIAVTVGTSGLAAIGSAAGTSEAPITVSVASPTGEDAGLGASEIMGPELRLRVLPDAAALPGAPEPPEDVEEDGAAEFVHERCRILGTLNGGAELSASGVRIRHRGLPLRDFDSLREVVALFDEGVDYAVSALRPRKGKGHDRDAVRASVLAEGSTQRVDEPRLSTAYDAEGRVLRVGLELWLEAEEQASDEVFPHRTAAEAAAPPVRLELDRLVVEATLMRAHSRGREGVGLYSLLRPR